MTQIGTVYGQALYALAQEENLSEEILQQLQVLQECFDAEPEYVQLLSCVSLSKPERCQLLDESMSICTAFITENIQALIHFSAVKIKLFAKTFHHQLLQIT